MTSTMHLPTQRDTDDPTPTTIRTWEPFLRAERIIDETGRSLWELADERASLELPNRFLRHLHNRSMSPTCDRGYAGDLAHFFRFLNDGR
ncbi:hypothetical protein [Amycolatopsis australiensis]|uniref:Phage integrase, N-terminal SAM-like domain n=1 Tax=Amycolatopsis australiensis TaxID=546364 RepID=A0A1K1SQU8_9PSEU|nr:hypothetical protein [Amycolatopsis australiensis]SFW86792.1 hypothetical protein SAMN04489730_6505 [Amycolatopsis australiensis]